MNTKRFKNTGKTNAKFKIWGDPNMAPKEYDVAPGEECDIPLGYAGNFIKRRAPELVALDKLPAPSFTVKAKAPAKAPTKAPAKAPKK